MWRGRAGEGLREGRPLQPPPPPAYSSQKKKEKKHIFSAFWHSNMKHIQDLLSLLGPDIPHGPDPSKLLPGIWTCCCRGITRSGDTFAPSFQSSHTVSHIWPEQKPSRWSLTGARFFHCQLWCMQSGQHHSFCPHNSAFKWQNEPRAGFTSFALPSLSHLLHFCFTNLQRMLTA